LTFDNPDVAQAQAKTLKSQVTFEDDGVDLHTLNEFVDKCGGLEALKDFTTEQVNAMFQKRFTIDRKVSYCEMLKQEQNPAVGPAQAFIVHTWKEKFVSLVLALRAHFDKEKDTKFWIDLFSINQHDPPVIRTTWLNLYGTSIEYSRRMVLILNSWNEPVPRPFTRSWCLYELFSAATSGCSLEVAMEPDERVRFNEALRSDFGLVTRCLSKIRTEPSEATVPTDRDMLFRGIRHTLGFGKIDDIILKLLQEWLIAVTRQAHHVERDGELRLNLAGNLANLLVSQELFAEAEKYSKECFDGRRISLGESDPNTLSAMNSLATLYEKVGKLSEAKELYEECLVKRQAALGDSHPDSLVSLNNLACLLIKEKSYTEAEALYLECLDKTRSVHGPNHPDTLSSLNNLAALYFNQDKFDEAEPLFIDCLKKRAQMLGGDNPATLTSLSNLAGLFIAQKKYMTAEPMLLECFERRKRVLGDTHPQTEAIVSQFLALFEKMKTELGPKNPDVIQTCTDLITVYRALNKQDEARKLCRENGLNEKTGSAGLTRINSINQGNGKAGKAKSVRNMKAAKAAAAGGDPVEKAACCVIM
jgi:tetratricopeptide (TPR) repeat protein